MEDAGGSGGSSAFDAMQAKMNQRIQIFKDKTTPHGKARWAAAAVLVLLYAIRIYFISGFYIITYALGIYLLHLFIGFLSPKTDVDKPVLPTDSSNGKGFERRLSEFTFWCVRGIPQPRPKEETGTPADTGAAQNHRGLAFPVSNGTVFCFPLSNDAVRTIHPSDSLPSHTAHAAMVQVVDCQGDLPGVLPHVYSLL